ncbi:MAG: peptidylprolyl isomerase [Lentimicrobium sp.]|jgi:peptidyl-prolyl cis-trans isomerase B (cyclophilin B)|nr:peptidylprolyl isomerase [Lentimicrobium sp.]MDD2528761.1 peptidylprolyl isomerase [Lentimicrobiaceae bacterium]MDD4597486.1 peptidylprolyl isomerase [Lentimicrobiaceae bacterium]MDY0025422.1 peptidylprolyl isomerase [Lentimicrobium sp.]HAH59702.1 peptidylprolyl isomerase [Bacteroidales bacterium]
MKKLSLLISIGIFLIAAVNFTDVSAQTAAAKPTKILIETDYGNLTAVLYNETPQHRDNFVKLIKQGWYNGSIFHRVINRFMIQGGGQGTQANDPGYTIPAEFNSKYFHKKGALAAARKPDQVNPKKASSGSQFYIVQGQILQDQQLDIFEKQTGKKISAERRKVYKTIGGTPHLDDDYTVFGEVISGLDVIDKIAAVQTAAGDRPVKDVKMKITVIK